MDAFEKNGNTITVGYRHKLYPSPVSDNHRAEVEQSLTTTIEAFCRACGADSPL